MKSILTYLFSLLICSIPTAQEFENQKDSLSLLPEKQCIEGSVHLYEISKNELFYNLALSKISSSKNRYKYLVSKLNISKANSFYETNLDSTNHYLQLVQTPLDSDSSITLRFESNRTRGMALLFDGKYIKATQEFMKNVDLSTSKKDSTRLSITYSDIAIPNYYMENFTESIKFWELAANLSGELKDYKTVYDMYLNIALAYSQSGDKLSAKSYKNICIQLTKDKKLPIDKVAFYLNMGVIDYNIEDYASAIHLFKTSSQYAIETDDLNSYAKAISNISACYIEQDEPEKSIVFLNEALYSANETMEPKFKSSLYKMLGEAYSRVDNHNKAYTYLDSAYDLKQELLNESRTQLLTEMQEKYHSIQKDKKIAETQLAYNLEKSKTEQEQLKGAIQGRQKIFLYLVLSLLVLFTVFMYNRFRITRKQKSIIELQQIRTKKQKKQIEIQHIQLEETHKEISDSIKYAERLQLAILPSQKNLKTNLRNSFVVFRPKDVVSGDFYWSIKLDNRVYFAAADCTGHGVPGAMVSVVCSNALNRSVKEFALRSPAEILDKTRELVIETFAIGGEEVKDGMDISICCLFDKKLEFSGANNPLWIIRDSSVMTKDKMEATTTQSKENKYLFEIRADKQPIGLYYNMSPFTNHEIEIFPNDKIYLATDGYADQFGGIYGKKMKYRPFKSFLLEIADLAMQEQKNKLEEQFKSWKGNLDQIDDVCIIGVRVE